MIARVLLLSENNRLLHVLTNVLRSRRRLKWSIILYNGPSAYAGKEAGVDRNDITK